MPFQVDPNAVYPISVVAGAVIFIIFSLKIFARQSDIDQLKIWILEDFVNKEGLADFRKDMDKKMDELHLMVQRIADRLDRRNP